MIDLLIYFCVLHHIGKYFCKITAWLTPTSLSYNHANYTFYIHSLKGYTLFSILTFFDIKLFSTFFFKNWVTFDDYLFWRCFVCYNNKEHGSQIVIDGSRAKESSTGDCQCTITSDNATQLNISSYNNIQPGVGCGSTVRLQVGGATVSQNCFVDSLRVPYASPATVQMDNILSANTDYCIFVESGTSTFFGEFLIVTFDLQVYLNDIVWS